MEIKEFFTWIIASGGATAIASFICERIASFQAMESGKKEWAFFGITSLIWLAGYLVINYVPASILEAISPYFLGISGLFIEIILGKVFHKIDKK